MRADERDISRYFRRKVGISEVRDVILLRDRRTGRHKGCAYVEVGRLEDVDRALGATGKTPDFQRFPILVKRAEAEKNALALGDGAVTIGSLSFIPPSSVIASALVNHGGQPVQLSADGMRIEAQKVYVGSIEPCVTQPQLHAVFSQFGTLEKILLQTDASTGMSRGFAFLTYRDPKDANLAIQTMSGQMLAGRPLKTGWANQQSSAAGVVEVKTDQFPDDANEKIIRVNAMMNQLTGTSLTTMIGQVNPMAQQALLAAGPAGALGIMPSAQLASVADAALDMALGVTPIVIGSAMPASISTVTTPIVDAKIVGRMDSPTQNILVHNMFDKDEETERGWEEDIRLDFEEECAQYGKIVRVVVMSDDPGGMIYASFDSVEAAMKCATSLAGRWFDKRQLRVEFVDSIPNSSEIIYHIN